MKRFSSFALPLALSLACCATASTARAQDGVRPRAVEAAGREPASKAAVKPSDAQTLYDEAAQYAQRKFDEFREKQIPYDRALEEKTLREQKELALQNAMKITARPAAGGVDFYYAGLLYALAEKGERALVVLRRFLEDEPAAPADLRQKARSVSAQQAAQLGLLEEAERSLSDYTKNEPRGVADLHRTNLAIASAYVKQKDYARASPRAGDAYAAALEYARTAAASPAQRDSTIYGAGAYYASVLLKAGRRADAVRVAQEMRARAVALPSARLYGQATEWLLGEGEEFSAPPEVAGVEPVASPEIKVAERIGEGPVRLSEMRGKVVLLDFWATWCGYCVKTMPRLNALQQAYKGRGLVILGLNEFEGQIEGRDATHAEELDYFRQFKRRMNVSYDFGVAADAGNARLFGVASLPTAVLIDRRGRVRFITVGASDAEAALMKKMILKLLDENP
jgi:thiol-disulfide isomerase/thioredoxin